jgi:hypothetical protein
MRNNKFQITNSKFLIPFLFLLCLTSCEREVHIKLAASPPQLVVQGAIENGQYPYVFLTSTIGFFSKVDLTTLQNSFIHGATITVSDGTNTNTLVEYSFDTGKNSKFYIYSIDTNNFAGAIMGQIGKYYTLTINYNGKTYTSVTKIPNPKGVDSLWFDIPTFKNDRTPDSAKQLFCNYTDPDTPGNYVRYLTKRNSENYYPSDIFSDEVVNGKVITDLDLYAGYDDSTNVKKDSLRYFYPGDTVTLKWCEIDKNVYKFWNTYNFAANSTGNPFSSPINVQSNISNGALGVWEGDGTVYRTIIVHH